MAIDIEHRRRVIAQAVSLLFDERIPKDADLPISEAWHDDEKFRVVEEAVSSYEKAALKDAGFKLIKPLHPRLYPLFFNNISAEVKQTTKDIARRAEHIPLESIKDADDFEKRAIGNDGELGKLPGNGVFVMGTIREEIWFSLTERMLKRMLGGRRDSSGRYEMLPPPGSVEFKRAVMRRFKIDAAQLAAWKKMPAWKPLMIDLFYTLMAEGTVAGQPDKPLENREKTIELRKAWFADMVAAGVGSRELRNRMAMRIMSLKSDNDILAGGWLRRFMPEIALSPLTAGLRAASLIREIKELHEMGPYLGPKKFIDLLPDLAEHHTIEGMRAALKVKDIPSDKLSIFRADTILLWHAGPSNALADRLQYLVARNKKYSTIQEFSKRMLGTSPEALFAKIGEMAAAGVKTDSLLDAMREKFKATRTHKKFVGKEANGPTPNAAAPGKKEAIMSDRRIGAHITGTGETFSSIAKTYGTDPLLLYLQNAGAALVKGPADSYEGPVIEHEVNLWVESKDGEHLDRLAQRLHLDPIFLLQTLRKNGIEPEWKMSDSWSWYEMEGIKILLTAKVSIPDEAIVEGATIFMPWAERPIGKKPSSEEGVSKRKKLGGIARSKEGSDDRKRASKDKKEAALLDSEKSATVAGGQGTAAGQGAAATAGAATSTGTNVKIK